MPANLENSSGHRTGEVQVSFQSQRKATPKNAQNAAQVHSSHASKVMLKILQARLQEYVNRELPDVQAGFRKGRGSRDQIAGNHWIIKKAREFQKNIYFCFIDYSKVFVIVNKTEGDVFLEFSCFFNDPADVYNLMSGSSKASLDIWKFTVHVLLKPSLENFERYFTSV